MLSTTWIIALAGIASSIALFALIAKAKIAKPKKVERHEKAQILKQLLALSEGENTMQGISRRPSVAQKPVTQKPSPRLRPATPASSRSRAASA
jgi:hypothetical protein